MRPAQFCQEPLRRIKVHLAVSGLASSGTHRSPRQMTDFKDTLLSIATYPDPTPEHVVDQAIGIAKLLDARISCVVSVLDRRKLAKYYAHGSWLVDVPDLIDATIARSRQDSERLFKRFARMAEARGNLGNQLREDAPATTSADFVTACSRLRDLTFLPIPDFIGLDELVPEDVIFGSGRPVILLPAYEGSKARLPSLDRVVVAWDFSRAAARALGDALPLLQRAKHVQVVLFCGEKDIPKEHSLADLDKHLRLHGLKAELTELDVGDESISDAISDHLTKQNADMLVMGAFGHSRLREFVLGGATRGLVRHPPVPVFMSH